MTYTNAHKNATMRYKKENIKRIPLEVTHEQYNQLKTLADNENKPINRFIKDILTNATNIQFYK